MVNLLTGKNKNHIKSKICIILFCVGVGVISFFINHLVETAAFRLALAVVAIPAIIILGMIYRRLFISFLILGFILFSRGFAHLNIRIGALPIFVTEAILIITIVTLLLNKLCYGRRINYLKHIPLKREFALLYIFAIIILIYGLFNYSPLLTLRHSAIIYYSIFCFIMPVLFSDIKKIETLFKLMFAACLIVAISYILKIQVIINRYGGLSGFSYFYLSMAVIFESLSFRLLRKASHKILFLLAIVIQLLVIVLIKCRASWVALFATFIFLLLFFTYRRGRLNKQAIKIMCSFALALSVLILSFRFLAPKLFERLNKEAASIIFFKEMQTSSAGNVRWRLVVWKDMLKDISKKPILGWGFGKGFMSSSLQERGWLSRAGRERGWIDPHNSFLNLLYRTGLIGFLFFLTILWKFLARTVSFVKYRCEDRKIRIYITALLLCMVFILSLSFFGVVLEAPYMGSFLWISMGLIIALKIIYKKNRYELQSN